MPLLRITWEVIFSDMDVYTLPGEKTQFRKKYMWYTCLDTCIENDPSALRPQH